MANDIVKQGYVKFQSKNLGNLGVWNKKWLLLRRQSCKGPVRLERYKDEETASVMAVYGAAKRIIDLTKVGRTERLPESVKKHAIGILVDGSHSIQFCAGSEMEAESWLNAIRDEIHPENRLTHESFPVYLMPNDFTSTSGDCTLQLERDSIRLLDMSRGGRLLVKWPYSGLRRYGIENNLFTIEAGSSCPGGPGTFFFRSNDSEFIFQRVQTLAQALSATNGQSRTPSSSFSQSNWGNILSIRELSDNRSRGTGAAPGGSAADEQNLYQLDQSMPPTRPPSQRTGVPLPSRPSEAAGPTANSSPYSELSEFHPPPTRTVASGEEYSMSRGTSTGAHQGGNYVAGDAAFRQDTSQVEVVGAGGPYYTVSRPRTTNDRTRQTPVNETSPPGRAMSRGNTVGDVTPTSEEEIIGVGGAYYTVSRPRNESSQPPATGSSRQPSTQARSNSADVRNVPYEITEQRMANDQIRTIPVEGPYYSVTRRN